MISDAPAVVMPPASRRSSGGLIGSATTAAATFVNILIIAAYQINVTIETVGNTVLGNRTDMRMSAQVAFSRAYPKSCRGEATQRIIVV